MSSVNIAELLDQMDEVIENANCLHVIKQAVYRHSRDAGVDRTGAGKFAHGD